jgi:peptide chain release factor 2
MKRIADVRSDVDAIAAVDARLDDAAETLEILGDEPGAEADVDAAIAHAAADLERLEMAANFDRPYDSHGAIVTIRAGAGGTDAADWTQMLERMYLKWAKLRGFEGVVVEEAEADEAGLRLATFFVRGKNAYGMLESERGVHRLVRISPFDQQHRRQTSFAEVDVVPEIEEGDVEDIEIRPEDLRVETFKASGAGGQYVNKTESAVRIIHVPTNTIVASQQERSQMQNRDVAMNILRAKLVQREREEREAKLEELRGERRANEWGSQIRSYTLNPFQLVKDHRTGVETGNTEGVLEGDIEQFIWPYLQARARLAPSAA